MKLTKIFGIVLSLHVGVILLVMFQPGCQTVKKKETVNAASLQTEVPQEKVPDAGFNSGLGDDDVSEVKPAEAEFSSPTRPDSNGLIVPGQGVIEAKPLPPILETPGTSEPTVKLRPSGLSIYKVQRGDTLWGIARKKGVSLSALLGSNPSLNKDGKLSIGQEIMIPEDSIPSTPATSTDLSIDASSTFSSDSGSTYIVQKGDSLSRISRRQGVSLNDLMAVNGLSKSSIIKIGQVLKLPGEGVQSSVNSAPTIQASTVVPDGAMTHKVQKGDNLTRIAALHGATVKQIMEWNGLVDAGRIRIGQVLIVSGSTPGVSEPSVDELLSPENAVPIQQQDSSVEGFFKGASEDRPIIDVSEESP